LVLYKKYIQDNEACASGIGFEPTINQFTPKIAVVVLIYIFFLTRRHFSCYLFVFACR